MITAFQTGNLFPIGTSMATGQSDVVVYGSVHFKSTASAGPHGFPDGAYFENVNGELDGKGIPRFTQRQTDMKLAKLGLSSRSARR